MGQKRELFIPGFRCLVPSSIFVQDSPPTACEQRWSQLSHSAATAPAPGSPDLIIITSWTGAVPKHIAKYTRSYNDLYPPTPIMVITTHISDMAVHTTRQKTAALAPAVDYLRRQHSSSSSNQILLHAFSDGGSNKAVCLAEAYLASTGRRLPVAASVLDSTPGRARCSSNIAGFRRSLPRSISSSKVLRATSMVVGAFIVGVHWVLFSAFVGVERNVFDKTRRGLNDETLWDLSAMPRTYVYSQADDLISWTDVQDHAVDAAEKVGMTSRLVRFQESGHCCHAKESEALYWAAVKQTWEARKVGACPLQ